VSAARWADPLVVIPLAGLLLLGLARLARIWPALRPLIGPAAVLAFGVAVLSVVRSPVPASPWVSLVYMVPLLMVVARGTTIAFQWLFRRRRGTAPPAVLESVLTVVLYGVGAGAIAHHAFGVELTPVLATSAVVGAVVGLALQDTLGNLFAGIALHGEGPFQVGDWVKVGAWDGRVEQVSWRATRLRTSDGDTLTLPNNDVARNAVLNYSAPRTAHSKAITVVIGYHIPPNRVLGVIRNALDQVPGKPAEPASSARLKAFLEHGVQYEIRFFAHAHEDVGRLESEVLRLLWYHLRRSGIEVPVPTRSILMQPAPAVEPWDTPAQRLQRALRTIDLFRPLRDDELQTVTGRFRPLHFASGERIIEEGTPGDSFFIIDQGTVVVSKRMGGVSREVARLRAGEFFGEMALLTGEQRSATITAHTDVDLFTIDKAGFQDIVASNPAVAVDISTLLSERRDALSHAEGDLTTPLALVGGRAELKRSLLDRIRGYFGI
jgi:small-conductance mechanosensitive channel/CRP-like cAMP-binding protein